MGRRHMYLVDSREADRSSSLILARVRVEDLVLSFAEGDFEPRVSRIYVYRYAATLKESIAAFRMERNTTTYSLRRLDGWPPLPYCGVNIHSFGLCDERGRSIDLGKKGHFVLYLSGV
jgi:hypothetical protein